MAGFPGALPLQTTEGWEWEANEGPNSFPGTLTSQTTEGWEFSGFVPPFYTITTSTDLSTILAGETVTITGSVTRSPEVAGNQALTIQAVRQSDGLVLDERDVTTDAVGDFETTMALLQAGDIDIIGTNASLPPTTQYVEGWEA